MDLPDTLEAAHDIIRSLQTKLTQLEEENDLLALTNQQLNDELRELRAQSGATTRSAHEAEAEKVIHGEDEHLLLEGDRNYVTTCATRLPDASAGTNVICIRFLGEGNRVIYGGVDKFLRIYNWHDSQALGVYELPAPALSLDVFQNIVLCGCMDGSHHIIDTTHMTENRSVTPDVSARNHQKYISSCRWSMNGDLFAIGSHDKKVSIYRRQGAEGISYELVETVRVTQAVECLEFVRMSQDGVTHEALVIAMRETPFMLYVNTTDWTQTKVSVNAQDWDSHVSFSILYLQRSPDGRYILAATDKSRHIVYAVGTNRIVRNLYGHVCQQYSNPRAIWDHSGKYIYSNSETDNKIHVYSVASESIVHSIDAHSKVIRDLAIHPAAALLATASYDRSIAVWN